MIRGIGTAAFLPVFLGLSLVGGCGSRFQGEWVERTPPMAAHPDILANTRPMALQFVPPTIIRSGAFSPQTNTVDPASIQESEYSTLNGRTVAEFGRLTARVENGLLIVQGADGETHTLEKTKGIFPSMVDFRLAENRQAAPLGETVAVAPGR